MNGSRPLSSPPPNWPSMRRRCRCSIPGAARPRPATSGRSRVMTGPGAEPTRRLSPIPTRRGAAVSISRSCSQTIAGIAQCAGYAPYKKLTADRITVAFGWSHLRREFFKIAERGDAPIATEAVARIAQIYVIEKDVRGTSANERRVARQARSRQLVDALRLFFEKQHALRVGSAG